MPSWTAGERRDVGILPKEPDLEVGRSTPTWTGRMLASATLPHADTVAGGLRGAIEPWHLIVVLVVALLVLGPKRLPEVGKSLGDTIREWF